MSDSDISLDRMAKYLEEKHPLLWRRVYTKHIDAPGNYRGPKAVAVSMASSILQEREGARKGQNSFPAGELFGRLEKYDTPTYYVSKPLLEAIIHTHPPSGMAFKDIAWPFPALIFMLPIGAVRDAAGQNVYAVGASRFSLGDDHPFAVVEFWMDDPPGAGVNFSACVESRPIEEPTAMNVHTADGKFERLADEVITESEVCKSYAIINSLAANLMLLMQARPELIEPGEKTKRVLKSGVRVYRPTFIGRKYTVLRKERTREESSAHFTELRWRAGHLRRQHFGKGREQEKIIFIDPYIAYSAGLVADEEIKETR